MFETFLNSTLTLWNPLASIATWFTDQIRSFFGSLDAIVYNFISVLYQLLMDLADAKIFGTEVISSFSLRIYTLLGIFMLFKVTFSLITYIVSPDQFTDKTKGVQHLIKNILITFLLLIITPWAFDKIQEVQTAILSDNIVSRLILGTESPDNIISGQYIVFSDMCCNTYNDNGTCSGEPKRIRAADDGEFLAIMTFRPFFQLDPKINPKSDIPATYCSTSEKAFVSDLLGDGIINHRNDTTNNYTVNYHWALSTVIGVLVCLILISFCFDVAVRSIKLGFLQIIAPIPIISYVDPKSGKDGMFKKWLKSVGVTWAGLFVRLAAIYFAIYVIALIPDLTEVSTYSDNAFRSSMFWIHLFIILGALIFAKQLPKLLTELTGIKLDGSFQLNPFKKIEKEALGGKQISRIPGAVGSAAIGGVTGAIGAGVANKMAGQSFRRIAGQSVLGLLSGTGRGVYGGLKNGKDYIKQGTTAGKTVGSNANKKVGTNIFDRTVARVQTGIGIPVSADIQDLQSKTMEEFLNMVDTIDKKAEKEIVKDNITKTSFNWTDHDGNVKTTTANINFLQGQVDLFKNDPTKTAEEIQDIKSQYEAGLKKAKSDYKDRGAIDYDPVTGLAKKDASGNIVYKGDDVEMKMYKQKLNQIINDNQSIEAFNGMKPVNKGSEIKAANDIVKDANITLKNSPEWKKAHDTKQAISSK